MSTTVLIDVHPLRLTVTYTGGLVDHMLTWRYISTLRHEAGGFTS